MKKKSQELKEELISMETNMSEFYNELANIFDKDSEFFRQISKEELRHAQLVRNMKNYFDRISEFPKDLLIPDLENLKKENQDLEKLITRYKTNPPTREEAFNKAFELEISAGEVHFQKYISKKDESGIHRVIKELNGEDKDHARRIKKYMIDNDIRITS